MGRKKRKQPDEAPPAAEPAEPIAPEAPPKLSRKAMQLIRLEATIMVITHGGSLADLIEFAKAPEQDWRLTPEQAKDLYLHAGDELLARNERDIGKQIAKRMATNDRILSLAMEGGDWRAALAANRQNAELLGLFPSKNPAKAGKQSERDRLENLQRKLESRLSPEVEKRIQAEMENWEPPPYDQLAIAHLDEPIPNKPGTQAG